MISATQLARRVKALTEPLRLHDWNLNVVWQASGISAPSEAESAACQAEPEYLRATLTFNLARIPEEELDEYIIHELLHCYVWELAGIAGDLATTKAERERIRVAEERLVTQLERILVQQMLRR